VRTEQGGKLPHVGRGKRETGDQQCDRDGESGSVITRAAAVSHYKAKKWGMRVVGYERRKDHPDIALTGVLLYFYIPGPYNLLLLVTEC
jgi:hypothetical protein